MNCSKAKFHENYLTSDFHTNTVISRRVCLPIKMASKTMIRSMKEIKKAYHNQLPLLGDNFWKTDKKNHSLGLVLRSFLTVYRNYSAK